MDKLPKKFFKFCPKCGTAYAEGKALQCATCGFVVYENQATTVSALITNERGEVMLVRRAIEPGKGTWDVPGGFLNYDEEPADGIIREMEEELHVRFTPGRILCAYQSFYDSQGLAVSVTNVYYLGTIEGDPQPDDDVAGVGWFDPKQLPNVALFNDHIRRAIEDYGKEQR